MMIKLPKRWFCVCFTLLLQACVLTNPTSKTIRFALAQAPINLDTRYATDAASERINRLIYQPLVDFDKHFQPVPVLADWQLLGPQHYRFRLRQSHQHFHHGALLTADDIAATYQSILSLEDSPHHAEFANIARIEVQNSQTVDFYLHQPDDFFPSRMIIGILPKDLITQHHDFAHHPIGSGGMRFVSWQRQLILSRTRDQQQFSFLEVKDPNVRALKLMRGEVDILQGDMPTELVGHLAKQANIHVEFATGSNFSYLGLNFNDSILKQIKVRQAIAHAIDYSAMLQYVLLNKSRQATAILPPEHWAGNLQLTPYTYQPLLARQLLEQVGIKLPLVLEYKTSTDAQRIRLATMMQAQMAPAGIELHIKSLDWGTFFQEVKQWHFQLYGLTWVGIKTPEIYLQAFGSDHVPPRGFNRGHYQDDVLDILLQQGEWKKITRRIHSQLPYIPLWYEAQFVAHRNNFHHYTLAPDGNWDGLLTIQKGKM